jgi:hypothetical protein
MTNGDYIDAFVNGFVARQQLDERYAEADQHRLVKQYRAAHPEMRTRAKFARMLRRAADRLSEEPAARRHLRAQTLVR